MSHSEFQQILSYLVEHNPSLYNDYANNFVLSDSGFGITKPAKTTDESYKELWKMVNKWAKENGVHLNSMDY
jgi:hypothetical protein